MKAGLRPEKRCSNTETETTLPGESVEKADRQLFDRISDHYAKKDIVASTRAARQAIVARAVRPIVQKFDTLGTVVDIGCGIGAQAEYLDGAFERYIGIDYSRELVEIGRRRYGGRSNVEFVVANIKDRPLPENTADTILAVGALHHVTELGSVMESLAWLAKPGAKLIAIEPQRGNPVVQMMRWIRIKVDSNYSPDQHFFSRAEVDRLLIDHGLKDIDLEYQGFLTPPFAQVGIRPQWIFGPLSSLARGLEPVVEAVLQGPLGILSWNIVAYARFDE